MYVSVSEFGIRQVELIWHFFQQQKCILLVRIYVISCTPHHSLKLRKYAYKNHYTFYKNTLQDSVFKDYFRNLIWWAILLVLEV